VNDHHVWSSFPLAALRYDDARARFTPDPSASTTHVKSPVPRKGYSTGSGRIQDMKTDQPSPSVVRGRRPSPSIASGSNGTPSQGSSSSDHKMSSLLQPPPAPMEGPQRMHDKVGSFLQDKFMKDCLLDWNEFSRDRAHVTVVSLEQTWHCLGYIG